VAATVENHNSVGVHATVKFSAMDGQDTDPLATILHFLPDLTPRESRDIDAAGFVFPCTAIQRVRTEVDVKGLTSPPR